jgi:hypothetical protein
VRSDAFLTRRFIAGAASTSDSTPHSPDETAILSALFPIPV